MHIIGIHLNRKFLHPRHIEYPPQSGHQLFHEHFRQKRRRSAAHIYGGDRFAFHFFTPCLCFNQKRIHIFGSLMEPMGHRIKVAIYTFRLTKWNMNIQSRHSLQIYKKNTNHIHPMPYYFPSNHTNGFRSRSDFYHFFSLSNQFIYNFLEKYLDNYQKNTKFVFVKH